MLRGLEWKQQFATTVGVSREGPTMVGRDDMGAWFGRWEEKQLDPLENQSFVAPCFTYIVEDSGAKSSALGDLAAAADQVRLGACGCPTVVLLQALNDTFGWILFCFKFFNGAIYTYLCMYIFNTHNL